MKACRNHVRSLIEHFHRDVTTHGFDVVVASSGTAETVARIAHEATGAEPLRTYNCFEVTDEALDDVVARLVKHRTRRGAARRSPDSTPIAPTSSSPER